MGRKQKLSHLTKEECERIMHVLQKDFEIRQIERQRIGSIKTSLTKEQHKTRLLAEETNFNRNCCIRCCQVFGFIFSRRRQCCKCGFNICSDCCNYQPNIRSYVCHFCAKQKRVLNLNLMDM